MDRSIFVWSKSTNSCYCGKCGKRQLGDRYNIRKHAVACGFDVKEEDDVLLVEEDSDWMYSLESSFDDGRSGDRRPGNETLSNKPGNGKLGSNPNNGKLSSNPNNGTTVNKTTGGTTGSKPGGIQPNVLILRICAPHLILIRGFKDRFSGMEWTPIFTAQFHAGSKTPNIVKNETGYEMDTLLSLIRAGRIISIRKERDADVIRRVFPCVDIFSLQMFVHIYRNKGFNVAERLNPATEKWLFGNIPGTMNWKKFEPKSRGPREANITGNVNMMTDEGYVIARHRAAIASGWENPDGPDYYLGGLSRLVPQEYRDLIVRNEEEPTPLSHPGKTPLIAMLYRQKGYRYILQVVVVKGVRPPVFLFTKGYYSCSEEVDLRELLGLQYYLVGNSAKALRKFSKLFPEYHLAEYMEQSTNVLLPLLAGEYHAGMELAAKAGAASVAECFGKLAVFEKSPALYRNLKDMFGLPATVLRALEPSQVSEEVLARLREIYAYSPAFLQFGRYTESMMEFYLRADVTHASLREGEAAVPAAGAGQARAARGNAAAAGARGGAAAANAGTAGAAAAATAAGGTNAAAPRGLAIRDMPQGAGMGELMRNMAANARANGKFGRARMLELSLQTLEQAEQVGDPDYLIRTNEAAAQLVRDVMVEEIREAQRVEGIAALSDKQILQILRYLEKHPDEGHFYCDYMNACAQLGDYLYGITPDIPIRVAHDRVVARILNKHDVQTQKTFEDVVSTEAYLRLTTCASEEDREFFKKDAYMVIAPQRSDDLFTESQNMHNCVRIYVPRVTKRSTRIYFLRKKKEPEKCFGTIEVSASGGSLLQAKAFANSKLDEKAQEFVVKWCERKGIAIKTRDIQAPGTAGEQTVELVRNGRLTDAELQRLIWAVMEERVHQVV